MWLRLPATPSDARWLEATGMIADLHAGLADADHARFVSGDLNARRHSAVTAAIYDRLAFFNARLASTAAPRLDLAPMLQREWLSDHWQDASNHQRRVLLHTALSSVTIAKASVRGGRFDSSRLQLSWRAGDDLSTTHLPWFR